MEQLLFHPKVVHIPIALALLMPLIAGGIGVAWWRGWFPKRVWLIAVLLQATLVASAFVAMQTGESEEERVERVVEEAFIEAHEHAAERFTWASVGVLVLIVVAGVVRNDRIAVPLAAVATLSSAAALVLAIQTGEAGGSLVYEHGAASAYATQDRGTRAVPASERRDRDED